MNKLVKDFTAQDWIDHGYKRGDSHYLYSSDYIWYKDIRNEQGRLYSIIIHVYLGIDSPSGIGYMADVAYQNSAPYTEIKFHFIEDYSIELIEEDFMKHWVLLGMPYYSKYESDN